MHRTTEGSPSITVSPQVEGGTIADVDPLDSPILSAKSVATTEMDVMSAPLISAPLVPVDTPVVRVDTSCVLHSFYEHKLDSGPVRLMTIAHAFNYRVAVLRDGVRSALHIGRSQKAEICFLTNADISWGQQVTVMFQIVSTFVLELPVFAARLRDLNGESSKIELNNDPWGHASQCDTNCTCLSSDKTASYVHGLLPVTGNDMLISKEDDRKIGETENNGAMNNDCSYLGVGRPGSVLFVFNQPGAYGRLLLATYVRWKTGLLVSSDWLRPVTRGAWRVGHPNRVHGSVKVS